MPNIQNIEIDQIIVILETNQISYNFKIQDLEIFEDQIKLTLNTKYEIPFYANATINHDCLNLDIIPLNIGNTEQLFHKDIDYKLNLINTNIKYLTYCSNNQINTYILDKNNNKIDSFSNLINQDFDEECKVTNFTSSLLKDKSSNTKKNNLGLIYVYESSNLIKHTLINKLNDYISFEGKDNTFNMNHNGNICIGKNFQENNQNTTLHIQGSVSNKVVLIEDERYNITSDDNIILVNAQKNNVLIFLNYNQIKYNNGFKILIKRIDNYKNNKIVIKNSFKNNDCLIENQS